jgi:FkbH-like protein
MAGATAAIAAELAEIRRRLAEAAPGHAEIFMLGQRILAAGTKLAEGSQPDDDVAGLPIQRVAVVGSSTVDLLARAIACGILQEGFCPILYQAPFGAYIQEILDPSSGLHRFRPELVVIATDWRDIVEPLPVGATAEEAERATDEKVMLFRQLWDVIQEQSQARIVQHVVVPPNHRFRGLAERLAPASAANQVRRLNERLLAAGSAGVHWVELDRLADEIGSRQWSSERFFHTAKLSFDPRFLPDYLAYFRGAWRAAFARGKKVLALDLDNTLWGGVIGDDGLEGIMLGPGSPSGEAFAGWQDYLKGLRARGVILAVCSKNAPEIAAAAFGHPHAVLRRDDFAAFECSWDDKVVGLQRVAKALNVGIDSIVFADDNPAECALVARELAEVAAVHLGTDPTQFIETLERGHWFDLARYTVEDLGRGEAYAARRQAEEEKLRAPDIESYLRSLKMIGRLYRPGMADLERLAQLEQKTNQFNLTTKRYSDAAIRAYLAREDVIVLAFRLSDRFGDHGLVSSLIAIHEDDKVRIDSWLMSCRIFSRTAEQFIMQRLTELARARGARLIAGEYLPTAKNGVVADLYARLGFSPSTSDGHHWQRALGAAEAEALPSAIAEPAEAELATAGD